ncbi:hypothetical protein GS504_28395 [Rhodococcus hoagii]|uniref:hypothetical protein n=1 Tax=Rhodococcus hoagii TaxID=43767 RepID=UPI00119D38A7|nr:hypothetical protein [Prescottella equi]NKS61384.1 hypothetical protein [Prescottella equi]
MRARQRITTTALVSALALGTAACQADSTPDLPTPETYSLSFQWDDSDPTIDLESAGARVVRAAAESDTIEMDIGRQYTYPGYADAVGGNGTVKGGLWGVDPGEQIGTLHLKLAVKQESAGLIDAVICRDETGMTDRRDNRFPLPSTDRSLALWAIRITAQRGDPVESAGPAPTTPPLTLPHQEPTLPDMAGPPGRSPRPTEDVFGDWKITRYEHDYSPETRQLCYPWIEQRWGGKNPPAPTRSEAEPPAIEPFYPGW